MVVCCDDCGQENVFDQCDGCCKDLCDACVHGYKGKDYCEICMEEILEKEMELVIPKR